MRVDWKRLREVKRDGRRARSVKDMETCPVFSNLLALKAKINNYESNALI